MIPSEITSLRQTLSIKNSMLDHSSFTCCSLKNLKLDDVNMNGTRISNANLSDMVIENAQLGGMLIRNIGTPPLGHPQHNPDHKHRPVTFESCNLENSTFTNCTMNGVSLDNCKIDGMKINGILLKDMIKAYQQKIKNEVK
ncbi:MAG: pentapeptide repeat-containing protein [Bacteroidetes bacterium]|nr:pentapeptide repeat-containing protein [Bacteroidota bacterium]